MKLLQNIDLTEKGSISKKSVQSNLWIMDLQEILIKRKVQYYKLK